MNHASTLVASSCQLAASLLHRTTDVMPQSAQRTAHMLYTLDDVLRRGGSMRRAQTADWHGHVLTRKRHAAIYMQAVPIDRRHTLVRQNSCAHDKCVDGRWVGRGCRRCRTQSSKQWTCRRRVLRSFSLQAPGGALYNSHCLGQRL